MIPAMHRARLRRRLASGAVVVIAVMGSACTGTDDAAPSPTTAAPTTAVPTTAVAPTTTFSAGPEQVTTTIDGDRHEADDITPAPARRVEGPAATVGGNWIAIESMTTEAISVIWSAAADSPDVAAALDLDTVLYRLHRAPWVDGADRDAVPLGPETVIYEGTELGFVDGDLTTGGEYTYYVVIEDGDGRTTEPRWRDGAAVDDTSPPVAITGFEARIDGSDVVLTWNESVDDYRFATYQIYRGVDGAAPEYHGTGWAANQTSFVDDDVPTGVSIRYEIEAVDFHTNASERTTVTITT